MNILKLMMLSVITLFALAGCGGGGGGEGGSEDESTSTIKTVSVVPSTNTVHRSNEKFPIEVRVVDKNGDLHNDGTVTVKYPDDYTEGRDVGSFEKLTVPVVKGVAKFIYISPSDLEPTSTTRSINRSFSDIVFEFYHNERTKLLTTYTVKISDIIYSPPEVKNLAVVLKKDTITSNKQELNIEVRVSDQYKTEFTSGEVVVKFPSSFTSGKRADVGKFESKTVSVDSDGIAHFRYTAPEDITANTSIIEFTFYHTNKPHIKTTCTLSIGTESIILSIVLPKKSITVTKDQESVDVKVNVSDSDNNPYKTGKVKVKYPDEASTRDIGRFDERSVDVINGIAIFNYTAPDDLDSNVSDITFTFYHEDNPTVEANLTIEIDSILPNLTIMVTNPELNITQNSQVKSVEVKVYYEDNNPYASGDIKIIYPDDVRSGRDIGMFASSTVSVVEGIASFDYTGPGNIDSNDSNISFSFYHEDNPTKEANLTVTIDNTVTTVSMYHLDVLYGEGSEMKLKSSKEITLKIKDDSDNLIEASKIDSIRINTNGSTLGTLKDSSENEGADLNFTEQNDVLFYVESNSTSGILPIKVDVNFTDANGDNQTLEKVINVTILSGPPTAMSLSYVSTSQDTSISKFIEKWVLTVTDKYSNKVSTEPSVSMGLIVGYAKSSNTVASNNQGYMYYEHNGKLNSTDDTFTKIDINDTNDTDDVNFTDMDLTNDKLVIFGSGHTYDASGKFEVDRVDTNTSKIHLQNDYKGNNADDLGFAIGHNHREDSCNVGTKWVATVSSENNNTIDKDTGTMILNISYDYYLTGKSVVLYVNMIGNDDPGEKIGGARKLTLRANGLEGKRISVGSDATGPRKIMIMIKGTENYYRNANFSPDYLVVPSDIYLSWGDDINDSMQDDNVSSCTDEGRAYVELNITKSYQAGTIDLKDISIIKEF